MTSCQQQCLWVEAEPYELDISKKNSYLKIDDSKLAITYKGAGSAVYSNDVGSIQADCAVPLARRVYYYELTVVNGGQRGAIAIGYAPSDFKIGRHPGWETGSYGYHGDDGLKFSGSSGRGSDYGPQFTAGDTVGAALNLDARQLFFTKNGDKLDVAFEDVDAEGLIPTIGLHSQGEKVELNFGRSPFKFDIQQWCRDQAATEEAAIAKVVGVPSHAAHSLVRSYLQHFGYADSLAAFDGVAYQLAPIKPRDKNSTSVDEAMLQLRHSIRRAIGGGDVEAARKLLMASRFASLLDAPEAVALPWDSEPAPTSATAAHDSSAGVDDGSGRSRGGSGNGCDPIGNGSFFPPCVPSGRAATAAPAEVATHQSERGNSSNASSGSPSGSPGGTRSPPSEWDAQGDDSEESQEEQEDEGGDDMEVDVHNVSVSKSNVAARCANDDVALHLACQQLIEYVRGDRIDDAVAYGQKVLSPMMKASPGHAEAVATTFALVAYSNPDTSPMSHLLALQRREATADVVNAAVLAAISAEAAISASAKESAAATGSLLSPAAAEGRNPSEVQRLSDAARRDSTDRYRQTANRRGWEGRMVASGIPNGTEEAVVEFSSFGSGTQVAPEEASSGRTEYETSTQLPRQHLPTSALQTVCAQLGLARQEAYEANGNQGEPFNLASLLGRSATLVAKPKKA